MTSAITAPLPFFADLSGNPLDAGYVYIGTAGSNPETSPITVYWDSALTQPAAQPLRTSAGSVVRNGTAAAVYTGASDYAITVRDSARQLVTYQSSAVASNNGLAVTALAADLASTASGKGSALIGNIASETGAVARTVLDKLRDTKLATDYSTIAAAAASGVAGLIFPAGTYAITSNTTFTMPVDMMPGATFNVSTGVTLAFNGGFRAGVYPVFSLTGTGVVTFDHGKTSSGYAEWWGAVSGPSGVEATTLAAINAALVALRKVELMPADYYVSSTVVHQVPNGELVGAGSMWDATYGTRATRVIVTNGTDHVIRVGNAAVGASPPSTFPQGLKVRGISFTRNTAPLIASGCTAVRVTYALEAEFIDIRGDESMNGWEFVGTTSVKVVRCSAKRTTAGQTPGTDSWKGFYINGLTAVFAGGNASLYLSYSHADDTRTVKTGSSGFYADGSFTDLFFDWTETVTCAVGINIQGLGAGGAVSANTDCRINQPTNDAFAQYGILVNNLGPSGSVEVLGGYQGPGSAATAAIQYQGAQTGASLVLLGGVLQMSAAPSCIGIQATSCKGLTVAKTQIQECASACVALADAVGCDIRPIIKTSSASGGVGVQLSGTPTANFIAPQISGKAAAAVTTGIQVVGTADARNEYNCSGIDSAAVVGGSANKLVRNSVQITATGLSGTNLVSGVMT